MLTLSLLFGNDPILIKLENGKELQGVFIGTYMDHVHVLKGERLYYYACDDIRSITSALGETFEYDCSENTVTAEILFPPELNPMTGEWTQKLPDVFNPDIVQPVAMEETDGVNTVPPMVDLGVVEPGFEDEVSAFEEKDATEEDFIMINGVKYVRASPDEESDENSIDVISERVTDVSNGQLYQEYEFLKKQRYMFPIAALMAFPISENFLAHPEVMILPIIFASSVGYFHHQKKINSLQDNLQKASKKKLDFYEVDRDRRAKRKKTHKLQKATKKKWNLYEEDKDRRVKKKMRHKKSDIQNATEKAIVGAFIYLIILIWM